jgi:hypothetical protein
MVERRPLVGHQRGAGDPAKVEGGLVDGEDAQIDETGGDEGIAASNTLSPSRGAASSPMATMRPFSQRRSARTGSPEAARGARW